MRRRPATSSKRPAADDSPLPSGPDLAEAWMKAMRKAVRQAIATHHAAGDPVAIWRDGGIKYLLPDGTARVTPPRAKPSAA